jgi:hypothetical protein
MEATVSSSSSSTPTADPTAGPTALDGWAHLDR